MHHNGSVVPSWVEADDPPWCNSIPADAVFICAWCSVQIQFNSPVNENKPLYSTRRWNARTGQGKAYVAVLQHDLKDTKNPIWKDSLSSTGQSKPISVTPLRTWPSSSQAACFEQVWWETVRAVLWVEKMLSDAGDAGHLTTAGHRHQEVVYPYHLMDRWFDQSRGVWVDARFLPHNVMANH